MAEELFPNSGLAGPADAAAPLLAPVAERISGPYSGEWYLATYVVAVEERFVAYSKICDRPPLDVFECHAAAKFATPPAAAPLVALQMAEVLGEHFLARRWIDR